MKTLSTSLKSKAGLVGISIYMVIVLGMIFNIKALDAQPTDPFTKITDDNFAETIPVIEGDYIVYSRKNIAKENGIYLYHIPTGDTISIMKCNHGNFTHIDMSGDRIVWQQYENDSWDIYNYLISRPDLGAYPLIDFEGDQESPAIDGDILVYINANGVPFSSNLFMYDIADARLTQITTDDDMQQWQPDVYGNYIVWASTHGNGDIFMYNIYKEEIIRITDDDARQRNPTIYKKHIVWEDQRRGNWDLYLTYLDYHYDIEPTKAHWPVWTGNIGELNSWSQVNAKISDNYIIYQDNRNYNWDLRLYTFINPIAGSSQVLIEEVEGQIDPSIWENKVVWTDERENSETYFYKTNLWMWEKPPGVDLSVSIEDQPDPVPLGSQLSYLVYVSNFGDQSAYNPDFTFNLPAGVDFVSMDGFGSGGYSRTADQVFCKLDSIPAHTTDTVTIIVTPVVEGEIIGNAIIEAVEEDIESLNNTASCKTKVIWKIPTMVDNGGSASVVVDRLGRPHFTYLSNEYGGQVIYSTFQHGILQRLVIDSSEYNCSPSIAVDSKGNLHLAYGKGDQEWDEEKNLVYRNIKNGILSEPEVLTSSAGTANNVTIKVDTKDSLHISFMTSLWSDGNIWYYKKSGQWSSAMIKAGSYNSSSFDIDTSGYAHFSYYDLSSLGLTYRTNSPDGILKAEESPDGDWHGGQMESLVCDIAVDHLSRPHVSYVGSVQDWQNEDYKYAMKSGSSWGKELLEDGDFAGADNAIDTDPAGNPHICFYNPLNGRLKYHYKEQGTWHKRIIDFPEYWNPGTRMMDICVDHLGYSHILYTTKNEILYVTNTIPIPEPEITVFPQILDFSARLVGDTTDAKRVNIVNTGEADLVISDISLVWRDSANFSISEFDCDILTPGDTCHVDVRFNPEIIGNKHAMLWITSNDPLNPEEGVSLKGEGLQGILWDYGSQDFGEVNLGDSAVNEY